MNCGQRYLALQIMGMCGQGVSRGQEAKAWPGSNSWPPNELAECQLVGFRETKDPSWASFVKVLPRSGSGTAAA